MSARDEQSRVERAKQRGQNLRGTIAQALSSDQTHFDEPDMELLKFHGVYQQDDRDVRNQRRAEGREKAYQFMLRVALPGGALSAEQYLVLDRIADMYANRTLRITTRQGVQFHGVIKDHLKPTLARLNESLMTTLGACGDVERNVMCSPAPLSDTGHRLIRAIAGEISAQLRPASRAYYEIWLDGKKVISTLSPEEPFYGAEYLPRKFKTGISLVGDNSIDLFSYDCALVGFVERGQVSGFNVLVGGGMGMTHNREDTFATLAEPLGYVEARYAVSAVRTVASIFRDHGNRRDRRHARLKYLIDEWGLERFSDEFRWRAPFKVAAARPVPVPRLDDYLGRREQDNGRISYGVFVESGRIRDQGPGRLKSALRTIMRRHRPTVRLTPQQSILLVDLSVAQIAEIEQTLRASGVPPVEELSAVRRYAMSCPALPTCGLALADSERALPGLLAQFERVLADLGLHSEPLTFRITGCPNGCARPYTADISFVGRKPGVYHIYVGGRLAGDRLADLYEPDVAQNQLLPTVLPLLNAYAQDRRAGESLGDFYQRLIGHIQPRKKVTGREMPTQNLIQLGVPV